MKAALYSWLSSGAGVLALVPVDRITPGMRDQGAALPAISYSVIGAPRDRSLKGDTAMVSARVQIDCWGRDEDETDRVAIAVKERLEGARFDHGGVSIRGVFLIDENESGAADALDNPFRNRLDFRVHHTLA